MAKPDASTALLQHEWLNDTALAIYEERCAIGRLAGQQHVDLLDTVAQASRAVGTLHRQDEQEASRAAQSAWVNYVQTAFYQRG